jgi:hypothetical protein
VMVNQRKRLTCWSPKGTGYDAGSQRFNQAALSRNPMDGVARWVQTMEMGNGITPSRLKRCDGKLEMDTHILQTPALGRDVVQGDTPVELECGLQTHRGSQRQSPAQP